MNSDARLIFGGVLAWFLARNLMAPLAFDDFCYAFVWTGEGNLVYGATLDTPIHSLGDVMRSQWNHYWTWGGRTIAHCLVQVFVSIDKIFFDVINTIMFGALIVLIARLADVRLSLKILLWIVFGLWLTVPQFMYGMLWLTGAINYLWMTVLQLTFLSFISRPLNADEGQSSARRFLLILLGLIVGWSNEAGALATILLAMFFSIRNKFFPTALAALILGFALMIFAPGNLARTHHIFPDGFVLTTDILIDHFRVWLTIVAREAILFIPIALSIKHLRRGTPFVLASLLIPTAMIFSPVFKDYAGFASPVFLLIASTAAFERLALPSIVKPIAAALAATMILALTADFFFDRQLAEQFHLIDAQRGSDPIRLPSMQRSPTLELIFGDRILNHYVGEEFGSHIWGLNADPNSYYNRAVANYYGLPNVVAEARP